MADSRKADELNSKLQSISERFKSGSVNVSTFDYNITAIKNLILKAYECGIIDEYRPLNNIEKEELSKNESDEIANAFCVSMDGKTHYITYKPRINKNGNKTSRLEHVNRSTDFIEALLTKISAEFSFLYCKSKVQKLAEFDAPNCANGFSCVKSNINREASSNKYELFFLIECMDNIDAAERLSNIIDSVLLDVDVDSADFFANMSYSRLERDETQDENMSNISVDSGVRKQLNDIITTIRTNYGARNRIVDFLSSEQESEFYRYLSRRDETFLVNNAESHSAINPLNSTVTCRIMPIGVFLNEIENYSANYEIKDNATGKTATFSRFFNPTNEFTGHFCPYCEDDLGDDAGLVVASTNNGNVVCCTRCAVKCAAENCNSWTVADNSCSVCNTHYCSAHTESCCETGDAVCGKCAKVFKDQKTKQPLSPNAAAVLGQDEDYIKNQILQAQKASPNNYLSILAGVFAKNPLVKRGECTSCKTRDADGNIKIKFFRYEDTGACEQCGKRFHISDLRKTVDDGKILCFLHRADCECGRVVNIENAVKCSHENCHHAFCNECKGDNSNDTSYTKALGLVYGKNIKKVNIDGKAYCTSHSEVCKCCGKIKPKSSMVKCSRCGLEACSSCMNGDVCVSCFAAEKMNFSNYKVNSSKTRAVRLNSVMIYKKLFTKVGVIEDNETIVFVYLNGKGAKQNEKSIEIYSKVSNKYIKRYRA